MLAITLASNSFAWFIYTTKVSSSISAKVREWKVTFDVNGNLVEEIVEVNVDSLFPGMDDFNQTLTVSNSGESAAKISFEVISATILGEDIKTLNLTDSELITYLRDNYPFSINITSSNDIIAAKGTENINISVTWPYESGNDELDTLWGNKAYDYHKNNIDVPSIKLSLKIVASQVANPVN